MSKNEEMLPSQSFASRGLETSVLVVEDDPEINELVGAYVQILGLRYLPAADGAQAMRLLAEHRPAVAILDVMLPDIDGFEICRAIRRDPSLAEVRVMMLTALDRPELRQRGLECGAVEYLTKPFDPERLLNTIRRLVGAAPAHCMQ